MHTELIDARTQLDAGVQLGGRLIRNGELVAFPTETVYGLGANGLDGAAVNRIFEAKSRPNDNPLILHIAKKGDARKYWDTVPENASRLMDEFWPGPLSLVYTKTDIVPNEVTANGDTVALRMPDNKTALALIRAAGVPIAAPSANVSGRPSPTTAEHVMADLGGIIPLIIDGGPSLSGVESTVLYAGSRPVLLRPGAVTKSMIESIVGPIKLHDSLLKPFSNTEGVSSPGMKHKHYAPNAEVILVSGSNANKRAISIYDEYEACGKRCIILTTSENSRLYGGRDYVIIGVKNDVKSLCRNLYSLLREYGNSADALIFECVEPEEHGLAYMNRLLRAANFRVES